MRVVPVPASAIGGGVRARGPARRLPGAGGALLGHHAAGVLREGRRLAARIPTGEILVIIMCEEVKAIDNLPAILNEVPGIGVVLIGEGDLSQNLGYPRQYDHPAVVEAMTAIRRICSEHDVACGHPHVTRHA